MNYLEIINKTLIELNYSPVAAFADLTKIEHQRLMNVINRLNKEICGMNSDFYFRQIIKKVKLSAGKVEYNLDINGKISKVVGANGEYHYEVDYSKFYSDNIPENIYSIYGAKYLFSPLDDNIRIFYSTENFVMDKSENLKADFEHETDTSIIPDNFAEKILVNGAAYNFKQNSSHPKYLHWKQEYDKAIRELLSDAKKISGSDLKIDGGYRKL